jgi:hypothetical protein
VIIDTKTGLGYNYGGYHRPKDNREKVRRRQIMTHGSLSGLGQKIGVDPAALEETIDQVSRSCEFGEDRDDHRPKDKLISIGAGPCYARQALSLSG